ncbi:hypothetical protein Ancab_031253 [Ancistrocladus abbreviatus]
MEKDQFPFMSETDPIKPIWNSSVFAMEIQPNDLNFSKDQLPDYLFNPNWGNPLDQNDPFESALSSIVSSPTASYTTTTGGCGVAGGDALMMRELIGRLGSICNSGEISPPNNHNNSTNTSCYSTPLNSPPKLSLSPIMENKIRGNLQIPGNHLAAHPSLWNADPGFVERAARFSCFGNRNFGGLNEQVGLNESELGYGSVPNLESCKLSRVSSNQYIEVKAKPMTGHENESNPSDPKIGAVSLSRTPENAELGDSREGSSVSEPPGGQAGMRAQSEANSRKRKSTQKGKGQEIPSPSPAKDDKVDNSSAKKSKPDEDAKKENGSTEAQEDQNGNGKTTEEGKAMEAPKPPEPPKDYIHVRARRGQATDSHSLAERVRREKISERMKFLQDLVPGCNKVTGKAVVLDEIINYVQSLQRQVEFLSMKLATVNPRMEVNMEALLSKDVFQSRGSLPQAVYQLDSAAQAFPFSFQSQQMQPIPNGVSNGTETPFSINPLNAALLRSQSIQLPSVDVFNNSVIPQLPAFWEDDLQTIVQTGFAQSQTQSFHGQMKVEL